MDPLILATYNVRVPCDKAPYDWASRRPRICKIIKDNKFHIFGTQEAVPEQIDDIVADTGFAYIGLGRDTFKKEGEHCCIFYDPARLELLNSGTFSLSENPDVPGVPAWDACCPRITTWGMFRDKVTGNAFCYYNTHLDHRGKIAQIKGIEQVVEHAKNNGSGVPMVLGGDFNVRPGTETYLCAASLLKDSAKISETPATGPATTFHGWGTRDDAYIDFIFVSEGTRVLSHRIDDSLVDGDFPSDHYPVITELVWE